MSAFVGLSRDVANIRAVAPIEGPAKEFTRFERLFVSQNAFRAAAFSTAEWLIMNTADTEKAHPHKRNMGNPQHQKSGLSDGVVSHLPLFATSPSATMSANATM